LFSDCTWEAQACSSIALVCIRTLRRLELRYILVFTSASDRVAATGELTTAAAAAAAATNCIISKEVTISGDQV